jgi:large subunit ribosomal protein L30
MAIKIKITQVRSGIGRSETQRRTLEGLGLRGPHKSVVLQDTLAIRGMIRKVSHLVAIEPADPRE